MNINFFNQICCDRNAKLFADSLSIRGIDINLKVMTIAALIFATLSYLCFRAYQWVKRDTKVQRLQTDPKTAIHSLKQDSKNPSGADSTLPTPADPITKARSTLINLLNKMEPEPEASESLLDIEKSEEGGSDPKESSDPELLNNEPEVTTTETPSSDSTASEKKETEPLQSSLTPLSPSPEVNAQPKPIDPFQFYQELQELTAKLKIESLPIKMTCCRFTNIECPKETHVPVDVLPEGEIGDYLHANHVKLGGRHFIAAQYPIFPESFWKVCKDSRLIIDLTNQADMNKGLFAYAQDNTIAFSGDTLQVYREKKKEIDKLNATHYLYKIKENNSSKEEISVMERLHYKAWPDFGGINAEDLDALVDQINQNPTNSDLPVVVHCRAGVGRTGTIIVASVLKPMILAGTVTPFNLKEKMGEIILEGRKQRGPMFVQSYDQLQALCEWCNVLFERIHNQTKG